MPVNKKRHIYDFFFLLTEHLEMMKVIQLVEIVLTPLQAGKKL